VIKLKIKIITRSGKQEFELDGQPIVVCVEDKKYLLKDNPRFLWILGSHFKRINDKCKQGLVEIMEEWK